MYSAWSFIVGHCLLNIILNSKVSDNASHQLDNICWTTSYGWDIIKSSTRTSHHMEIYFQSTNTMNQLLSTLVQRTGNATHCLKFEYRIRAPDPCSLSVFIIKGNQRTAQKIWTLTNRWNVEGYARIAVQESDPFEIEIWGRQSSIKESSIRLKNVLYSESECTSMWIGAIAPFTKTNEVLVAPCTQPGANEQHSIMALPLHTSIMTGTISASADPKHPGTTISVPSGSSKTHFKTETALLTTGKKSKIISSTQKGPEKEITMDDDSTSDTAIIIGCTLGAVAFVVAVVVIVLIVKWEKLCPGRQKCCKCCAKCSSKVDIEQTGNQKEH